MGERFLDLDIPSVLVAAMDVTSETPPPEVAITLPNLPAIVLLPGDDKGPPFRYGGDRSIFLACGRFYLVPFPAVSPVHPECLVEPHEPRISRSANHAEASPGPMEAGSFPASARWGH